MIAAVFDCVTFLQAAASERGPACACLQVVESGKVRLYVSPAILDEVRRVLTRPQTQADFPFLTHERADLFLQKLATMSILVSDIPDAGIDVRDATDRPYLNLAVAANVGYIVSWDKDLRDLMKDARFTKHYPTLQIVDPVEFLAVARPARAA